MLLPAAPLLVALLLVTQALATPLKDEGAAPDPAAAAAPAEPPAPSPAADATNTKDVPVPVKDALPAEPQAKPMDAAPVQQGRTLNYVDTLGEREQALLAKLNTKCIQREVSSCVMLKMVTYINKMLKKSSIEVADGLEISRAGDEDVLVVDEDLNAEEAARGGQSDEDKVSGLIANKLWAFVKSRSLRWNLFPEADLVLTASPDDNGELNLGLSLRAAKAMEYARKKDKNMGPLLAAAVMKMGLVGGVAFKALALLVGKAIILSKIAFLLAAIIWLKKLFSHQRHVTYEVVAHPHHSHSHVESGGHGHDTYGGSAGAGWGRRLGDSPAPVVSPAAAAAAGSPHDLAYSAHAPAAQPSRR